MASESEQEKRETLADIAAEIRAYGDRPPPKRAWLDIAERIEAIDSADAWRSPYSPGNAAAMREALRKIMGLFRDIDLTIDCQENEAYSIAASALSAPPRNCDVGTPEEQAQRFGKFCKKSSMSGFGASAYCTYECACRESADCKFAWAQTPYEAQEGAWK